MTTPNTLRQLYQQTWERLRHVDSQCMFFNNLYATIIAGLFTVAVIYKFWGTSILILALSVLTWFLNKRINSHIKAYEKTMKEIATELKADKFYTPGAKAEDKITLRRLYLWGFPIMGVIAAIISLCIIFLAK